MTSRSAFLILGAAVCAASVVAAVAWRDQPQPTAFKLFIGAEGVHRVAFDDLPAGTRPVASDHVALTVGGAAVPIRLRDGDDGTFGPGDALLFVGQPPRGEESWHHDYALENVYRLSLDAPEAVARFADGPTPAGLDQNALAAVHARERLEVDRLRLRFSGKLDPTPESWYWAKLTQIDRKGFVQRFDLGDFDPRPGEPLHLRAELRGWSVQHRRVAGVKDHHLEALWNGQPVARATWDGQDAVTLEVEIPPTEVLRRRENELRLRVPKRNVAQANGEEAPLVDVSVLNWIEIDYPRMRDLKHPQTTLHSAAGELYLALENGGAAYDADRGLRWRLDPGGNALTVGEGVLHVAAAGSARAPDRIEIDRPSALRSPETGADYIMIVHPRLAEEIQPLAELHERLGRTVATVDVEDVYDEFNHGLRDPRALRDFLRHATHEWPEPRPRWVLLVGDASWDVKNPEADDSNYADWTFRPWERHLFVKNGSTPYADPRPGDLRHRDLIPTWPSETSQGHAASDHFFVAFGDEAVPPPELAIGRLPVVEPEELRAIVDKTIRYAEAAPQGDWQRSTLWIANEQLAYQRRSDLLADRLVEAGYASTAVYGDPDAASNVETQQALHRALDDGQLLVHFLGHGGRYIWRTGAQDLEKNHDLFTLDDLDQLQATERLPLVLSMSCYSAPFDHPTADSIGEKFVRLPDRGAIGVIAASWRNAPSQKFSRILLEELLRPEQTIGEALMRAKQDVENRKMVTMYNLLGDPAIALALPEDVAKLPAPPEQIADGSLSARAAR
ncbi:MAG: C25 family cysteine peptidase [Acidobacteriota bacterium]